MPKDPKNQTPSGGAPAGEDADLAKIAVKAPPVAGESASDQPPKPPVVDDGRRTPEEWARELGHVDAPASVSADDQGTVARTLRRRPIREAKGFIFAAVKRYAGWGKQLPIDVRVTRAEYEEAVAEAMGTPLGEPGAKRALKWRHDVALAARAEAEKAGGER